MPVAVLKGDELSATQTSDWLGTATALLGEEVAEALSAVGLVLAGGELLPGQDLVAVGAGEAVTVPGGRLVGDTTLVDHPIALHAALCILLLITGYTHHFLLTGDETLVADWLLTHLTAEALLMPLLALVLILLHTCAEDVLASIAAGGEIVVVAVSAVQLLLLGCERLVHQ